MASTPQFKKIILIGLGGAGRLILTHLKRLFIDSYNVLPPSIKLLSLDTDVAPIAIRSALSGKQYTLADEEFLYMKVEQPIEYIKNSNEGFQNEVNKRCGKWFKSPRIKAHKSWSIMANDVKAYRIG